MTRSIVVIPARGGSKRVPRKNIALLAGKPLLAYSIDQVRAAGLLPQTYVSTEDQEIADVARQCGAQVIARPIELASDQAGTESVLLHALQTLCPTNDCYDHVVTLPPTSPLRRAETIARFVQMATRQNGADCFMSVTETRGDFWLRDTDGHSSRLFPDAPRRQQDRIPMFEENSAIYVTRIAALLRTGSILGESVELVPIDPIEALDINTATDLMMAEGILERVLRT